MKKNRYHYFIIFTLISFGMTGCYNPIDALLPSAPKKVVKKTPKPAPVAVQYAKPTPEKMAKFQKVMQEVALSTKDDEKYNKMTLDSPEKKAWFKNLMYRLWDRQITRGQFIAEGLEKYPNKKYEFSFVADGFQNRS